MSTSPSPWDIDYFNFKPPGGGVKAPSPKAQAPKPVPQSEALYMIQRHALQVLNDVEELEGRLGDNPHAHKVLQKLQRDAENTYKVIRRYLAENVAPGQGDFSA